MAERHILIIDDNPGDVRLVQEVVHDLQMTCRMETAHDFGGALKMLEGAGPGCLPDLVLLDLHMPGQNGLHLLERMKTDDRLRRLPIIVLSTSAAPSDIAAAYRLHANCYIVKPIDLDDFTAKIRLALDFWFSAVCLHREDS